MPNPVTLTGEEKAYLAEIIGCDSPNLFAAELLEITTEQETILKADVASWKTVRDDFDYIKGEVNSNPASLRRAIRKRVIAALDVAYLAGISSIRRGTVRRS